MPIAPPDSLDAEFDVCVVGAGPAGLAAAFDLHDRGLKTLLVEMGGEAPDPAPDPATDPVADGAIGRAIAAEIADPDRHAPVERATSPALGGASHLWGGRCVPLDRADFTPAPGRLPWPVAYDDLEPWWRAAAQFFGGALVESPAPGAFAALPGHDASRSETWGAELNMARLWRARIAAADGPAILLRARATGFVHDERNGGDNDGLHDGRHDGRRVSGVRLLVGGAGRGQERIARARHVVLACGGLGALRLLLDAERARPGTIAGAARLGEGYMGHLTGAIADLAPARAADVAAFGRLPLDGGGEARRRIQPTAAALAAGDGCNIAFWLDNPPVEDPSHGSGAASAKYLLLRQARLVSGGAPVGPHLRNVRAAPLSALGGLAAAAARRLAPRRGPGPLLPAAGGWRMHYHAEQRFDPANRVSLSDARDEAGLFRLRIDYGFAEADIAAVLAAHAALDADLRAAGAGELRYLRPEGERAAMVRDAARDGYHQLGGARMSASAADGVVDADCRVHGMENLWAASSCVFPSAGQANPTLTIVALARRLADHLARLGRG